MMLRELHGHPGVPIFTEAGWTSISMKIAESRKSVYSDMAGRHTYPDNFQRPTLSEFIVTPQAADRVVQWQEGAVMFK